MRLISFCQNNGTYVRWLLIKRCARKAQYLLFDLFKAFDYIESSHKSGPIFLYACATCNELPSNISTMVLTKEYLDSCLFSIMFSALYSVYVPFQAVLNLILIPESTHQEHTLIIHIQVTALCTVLWIQSIRNMYVLSSSIRVAAFRRIQVLKKL